MKIVHITPDLGLTAQLRPDEIAGVAAAGYRTLINARPDAEEPGQPASAELAAAAERCGLAYRHIPITPGQIGDSQVADFHSALVDLPDPVLAFCRTGTRAASLWALGHAPNSDPEALIAAAAAAGYDIASLLPRLTALRAGRPAM